MNFVNHVILVTGASSGIGASTAVKFAKEGAKLAIVGRNLTKLKKVSSKVENYGPKPLIIQADLSKEEELKTIVQKTIEEYGKLNVLINNAAAPIFSRILDGNILKTFDKSVNTNLRAPVFLTSLAAPHLIETKGNIVNISSVMGTDTIDLPDFIIYSTCKSGLEHFTRWAARELSPFGVRVNCIRPGPVKTDLLLNSGFSIDEEKYAWQSFKSRTALNRIAEPAEIADLVIYLASTKAKCITGSSFLADNGAAIK